jgi:hypothetical protein
MEKLKIFDKSGKRMLEEEKKMRKMNEDFEKARSQYLQGFPNALIQDAKAIFSKKDRLLNKAVTKAPSQYRKNKK